MVTNKKQIIKKHPIIGIIGCGVMGSAIAKGLIGKYRLNLYDKNRKKSRTLRKELLDLFSNYDFRN